MNKFIRWDGTGVKESCALSDSTEVKGAGNCNGRVNNPVYWESFQPFTVMGFRLLPCLLTTCHHTPKTSILWLDLNIKCITIIRSNMKIKKVHQCRSSQTQCHTRISPHLQFNNIPQVFQESSAYHDLAMLHM
jgi:hypothetical protein